MIAFFKRYMIVRKGIKKTISNILNMRMIKKVRAI